MILLELKELHYIEVLFGKNIPKHEKWPWEQESKVSEGVLRSSLPCGRAPSVSPAPPHIQVYGAAHLVSPVFPCLCCPVRSEIIFILKTSAAHLNESYIFTSSPSVS